jgi:O-antigen/teichoic acid export membrane protein
LKDETGLRRAGIYAHCLDGRGDHRTKCVWALVSSRPDSESKAVASASFARFADTTHARANLKHKALRAFSDTLVLGGAEFVLRLGFTAVLARLVTPEQFGIVMLVTAVTAIADNFRDLGLSTATIQREHITHAEVSNLFWINTAAGTLLAVIICGLAPLIALYFREPRVLPVTMALATTFVLGGLTVQHEALLGRQMRLGPKALMRLTAFMVSSLVAITLAAKGFGYWSLVWREIVRSALIVVGAWALCRWVPGRPRRDTNVRELIKFGSGLTATYMVTAVANSLDRFLLGRAQGASVVGLYRQSYQLVVAPMAQLMGPLYQVSLPSLSMLQDEPERFCRAFIRIVALVAMVSMPLGVLVCVFAEEVTLVMLGPQWAGAATFIRIFAIGSILQSVYSTSGFVLVSRGRSSELLRLTLAQTGLRAGMMCVGAAWGGIGVALADVASTAIAFAPFLHWSLKDSPVSTGAFLSAIGKSLGASLILAVTLALARMSLSGMRPASALAVAILVTMASFPAGVALMPGGKAELSELRSLGMSLLGRCKS